MPRPTKPIRLWLEPARYHADGTIRNHAAWVILGGGRKVRTGCVASDRAGAEEALALYIAQRRVQATRSGSRHPSQIPVADVLNLYLTDKAPKQARFDEVKQRIGALNEFFGADMLDRINGPRCRAYVAHRGGLPVARRELEDLRAAINYHRKEGYCSEIVGVSLPDRGEPRQHWLTRSEVARAIWHAWRYREQQNARATDRATRKHVARFILVALYTGTRAGAIFAAALGPAEGRGWVDLDRGVFYRRAAGARETKKRQPPIRLPDPLLAHMRRWARNGQRFVVEWNKQPVSRIDTGFRSVMVSAGLSPEITPHVLRHTAATWQMHARTDPAVAAAYLGMTEQTMRGTYLHHHPDYQGEAVNAVSRTKRAGRMIAERNPGTDRDSTLPNVTEIGGFARKGR